MKWTYVYDTKQRDAIVTQKSMLKTVGIESTHIQFKPQ